MLAAVGGGFVIAACGWLAWAGFPESSQEAVANLAKAEDFFAGLKEGGWWWSPNFLGGTSSAPMWGTALTSAWLLAWTGVFGPVAGSKLAMLACIPLAAGTAFAFLRRFTEREGVAAVGALAYAMAPSLWVRAMAVEHVVVVLAMAVYPLACWGAVRMARKPSTLSAVLCGAACSALALTYSKVALLAAPVMAALALWALWKYHGLASWLRPRVLVPFLAALLILGGLPNLPALRESATAALFEFGPLEGWQQSFSSKSALHVFDRLGEVSEGFRKDFAPTTAAGGAYLGAVPLLLVALALARRRVFFAADAGQAAVFRASCGLALFSFWLSHGPFGVLSGTLRALDASATAADVFPAILWGLLAVQGWAIWALFPPAMPLRWAAAVLTLVVYFLVPGFSFVSWMPLYRDLRAPFDFYQVAGVLWSCAAVGIAAGMAYRSLASPRWRLAVVALAALVWGLDFAGHLGIAARKALGAQVRADFEAATAAIREDPRPGAVMALSGRYFYLRIPALTGRPLVQEAFQNYLQQRGYAALLAGSYSSVAEFVEFLRIAGVGFVLIDSNDPDLPAQLAEELRERLPKVAGNLNFEVLAVEPSLAPGFVARDAVFLGSTEAGDIAASLAAAAGEFAAIGPVLPGESSGVIKDGSVELADPKGKVVGRPFERLAGGDVRRAGREAIEIRVPAGPGWLVIPEAWHRDWMVETEAGIREAASVAFGGLLSAPLPAQPGNLRFIFTPPWWYSTAIFGGALGWLAFAVFCGALAIPAFRRRVDRVPIPPDTPGPRPPVQRPLIVIPTYNEADSLPGLFRRIEEAGLDAHLLVVDDRSPDGTAGLVRAHPRFGERVFLIERAGKLGLGSAYREGFRWAFERGYDACVEMDADLSHDPADVPRLLEALAQGADAAIGSRYLGGLRVVNWPEHRLLISSFGTQFVRFMTGMPLTDATSGFKALRREALERLDWSQIRAEGYGFQVELHHALWKSGARIVEVPITFTERLDGRTKMTAGIALEAMVRVVRLALSPDGRAGA